MEKSIPRLEDYYLSGSNVGSNPTRGIMKYTYHFREKVELVPKRISQEDFFKYLIELYNVFFQKWEAKNKEDN